MPVITCWRICQLCAQLFAIGRESCILTSAAMRLWDFQNTEIRSYQVPTVSVSICRRSAILFKIQQNTRFEVNHNKTIYVKRKIAFPIVESLQENILSVKMHVFSGSIYAAKLGVVTFVSLAGLNYSFPIPGH